MVSGMNIAARWKHGKLSLRAEGAKSDLYKEALADLGFTPGTGYYSVHFSVPVIAGVVKTIGAVAASFGVMSNNGVSGDPKLLEGAGS